MTPRWTDMTRTFGRIGLLSFGGPAAQIALMHDTLVARRKWLSEAEYLRALSLCMLLPGPEAMQLATYAGWRLRGMLGGLLAGLLFVGPGAVVVLVLALGYIQYGDLPLVRAAFLGVKAAVIVIVLLALVRLARKALTGVAEWALAGGAYVALFLFGLPFPAVVLAAGLIGYASTRAAPAPVPPPDQNPSRTIRTVLIFGAVWSAPLLLCWIFAQTFLLQIGAFFSKLAVVTFGGAYAVLAYMTQEVVQTHGWIETGQMVDALGLAETTPGPLILVTEFVALLAGYANGGLAMALAAGALTLWVTFVPCFLWIFAAGPYLDHIAARPRLSGALQAITAAVVGVILNLSVWFALNVLFARVETGWFLALPRPDWAALDPWAAALTVCAMVLMLRFRVGLVTSLGVLAVTGAALGMAGVV